MKWLDDNCYLYTISPTTSKGDFMDCGHWFQLQRFNYFPFYEVLDWTIYIYTMFACDMHWSNCWDIDWPNKNLTGSGMMGKEMEF